MPLESNLVDTNVMNEFDLEPYMDESMPQSSDVDASPASFNLAAGFSEVVILLFVSLVIYPILSLFWDIPQLQAEEKN